VSFRWVKSSNTTATQIDIASRALS
jgi:hypothetical protein